MPRAGFPFRIVGANNLCLVPTDDLTSVTTGIPDYPEQADYYWDIVSVQGDFGSVYGLAIRSMVQKTYIRVNPKNPTGPVSLVSESAFDKYAAWLIGPNESTAEQPWQPVGMASSPMMLLNIAGSSWVPGATIITWFQPPIGGVPTNSLWRFLSIDTGAAR